MLVSFVARPERLRPPLLDAAQREHAFRFAAEFRASEIAARCERPALREPHAGDGSALLFPASDPDSSFARCTQALFDYAAAREQPCDLGQRCPPEPLATLMPPPGLAATCAPVHAAISELAHTTEACSPFRPGRDTALLDSSTVTFLGPLFVGHAVRFHIAPMVARGDLAAAARHVLDAMRFIHDYSRHSAMVVAMLSSVNALGTTLDELLTDPLLTAVDAQAIVRHLDILLASLPTFDEMIRAEAAWQVRDVFHHTPSTREPDDHRAVMLLAVERWVADVDRACRDRSPLDCAMALPRVTTDPYTFDEDLANATSAEEAITVYYGLWVRFLDARRFIQHEAGLRHLRDHAAMRARTMQIVDWSARLSELSRAAH